MALKGCHWHSPKHQAKSPQETAGLMDQPMDRATSLGAVGGRPLGTLVPPDDLHRPASDASGALGVRCYSGADAPPTTRSPQMSTPTLNPLNPEPMEP